MIARIYGFFGYLRIVTPEHAIIETHPDAILDLRLDCPFDALIEFGNTFQWHQMDSMTHGHVPFGVVLLKCIQDWKSTVSFFKVDLYSMEDYQRLQRRKERSRLVLIS